MSRMTFHYANKYQCHQFMKSTPIKIINYPERGWLNVGRTRMVLFDTLQGFYTLRRVIDTEVGGNAAYLIFQAGIKGGFSFLEPMIQGGRLTPGPHGFAEGLSVFIDGGFGQFSISCDLATKDRQHRWLAFG